MKPIAQTFLVAQPSSSVDGVFLTKIDLFFKEVSATYGITVQIRTVDNGFPTSNMIAGGNAYLPAGSAQSSDDSSVASTFNFSTPPFLEINTQYALVVIPDGGTDGYEIWTGILGGTDALTNSPIYTNNSLGNLFISSNDLVFTPVTTESMKYNLYTANMTATSGSAVFTYNDLEFMNIKDVVGTGFMPGEQVYVSNTVFTGGSANSLSNTVIVANSAVGELANDSLIFLSTTDRGSVTLTRVVSAPNTTTIVVNPRAAFTNTSCQYGGIRSSGGLRAHFEKSARYSQFEDIKLTLSGSTANSAANFSNSVGHILFGATSLTTAVITALVDRPYDSLTIGLNILSPKNTTADVSYVGVANDANRTEDSVFIPGTLSVPNEFNDNERLLMSRSNELTGLPAGRLGNYSSRIKVDLTTGNNATSPFIDLGLGSELTYTYSPPVSEDMLTGVYLDITNTQLAFVNGEIVTQNTASGTIDGANSSYLRIIDVTGNFQVNSTSIVGGSSTANASIATVTGYDESKTNGHYRASRYISKSVILGDQQDAEDLICLISAYRPVGANVKVYGKFLAGSDTDSFNNKAWSVLTENTVSVALFSSPVLRDDTVELQFGMPSSSVVDTSGASVSNSANTISVQDTTFYSIGTFVYLTSNTGTQFNVRAVTGIVNNSTLQLSSTPSFTDVNSSVGNIPGLETQTGAFIYTAGSGIIRYGTAADVFFDTYKTFAIKIVPVSNNSVRIPIMQDFRCIALQS